MKSSAFTFALITIASFCFASCGLVKPEGARLNGKSVAGMARETARSEGFEIRHYKNRAPIYLPANRTWYTCFEERGMLLAAGEQFTVFLDDPTGRTRLHRDTGKRDWLSRERLEKLLAHPEAATRRSKPTR
ncbi:hypothetical protein [Luteolibacter soli]|uniref:Lipoprotein n=1 Tax=Luteolibacter soli TaxID=3135280 RepID=A0ABU9AZB6_9BACT